MKYGAYYVWLQVKGLTAEEREAVHLILKTGEQGWEWESVPESDGSIWIAPLIKGDNPDVMDKRAVQAMRAILPRRPIGQAEAQLVVERFERRR